MTEQGHKYPSSRYTGCGFLERKCLRCEAAYKPTSASQKVCVECKPAFRLEQNRLGLTARRRAEGRRIVGEPQTCVTCGGTYILQSGPQRRCEPCQYRHELDRSNAVNKAHIKRREWRKISKDRHFFGADKATIIERDGNACRKCGATEGLHVHHIDGRGKGVPFYERNNAPENLTTLCNSCHSQAHAYLEKVLYLAHPETVLRGFADFIADKPLFPPREDAPDLFKVDDDAARKRRGRRAHHEPSTVK